MNLKYKLVDCHQPDILSHLDGCTALLWHFDHESEVDLLIANSILLSAEKIGIKTFPEFNARWHFDDKIAQKYLFEGLGIETPDTWVFVNKNAAVRWIETCGYPIVHKLRRGASSQTVSLLRNEKQARRVIESLFREGISIFNRVEALKEALRKVKSGDEGAIDLAKAIVRLVTGTKFSRRVTNEKWYFYAQKFIPNNTYDTRVVIHSGRAIAIQRQNRTDDFRASGSGQINYSKSLIDQNIIRAAFSAAEKLGTKNIALDYLIAEDGSPLLVEASFGYVVEKYLQCEGFWTTDLQWHHGKVDPAEWIIRGVLDESADVIAS